MTQDSWERPAENWLENVIDPVKFMELLQNKNADENQIGQLFDQFVTQALFFISESNNARNTRLGPYDIKLAEQKADKFWRFGWACAARLGWNLETLLKCSNVVRVFSMVSRLFEHTFAIKGETDILSYFLRHPDYTFDSKTTFVSWLYARLVLIIDMQARVPPPPQKPKVRDPITQFDASLIEAKKINDFILHVRKHSRNAALHLDRLAALKLKEIEIPTFHYFQQSSVNKENLPKSQKCIKVRFLPIVIRIKCDLLLAHFAASHFVTARKLFDEVQPNFSALIEVHTSLQSWFAFDPKKFNGYKEALHDLGGPSKKRPKLDIDAYEFNTQRNSIQAKSSNFKSSSELEKATRKYKKTRLKVIPNKLYNAPVVHETLRYLNNGSPLWKILGCFDYDMLLRYYKDFRGWDKSEQSFLDRISTSNLSPILADILAKRPIPTGPVLFYIAQTEKLAENWDLTSWKKCSGKFFISMSQSGHPWKSYASSMPYEVLRISQKVHNSSFGYEKSLKMSKILRGVAKSLADESIRSTHELTSWAFRLFDKTYFVSLLNLGEFNAIILFNAKIENFKSPYLNFALIIAAPLLHGKTVDIRNQWKYFTSLLNRRASMSDIVLSKEKFTEVIGMLKNVRVCEYILVFFVSLYNKVANSRERRKFPYTEGMKTEDFHFIDKSIFTLNSVEVLETLYSKPETVDLEFISKVIELLLRNLLLFSPNSSAYSCQIADFLYANERYEEAALAYTLVMNNFNQGFFKMNDYDTLVTDLAISKLIHCFYEMKMFTLAAVTGQLLRDTRVHLSYIPNIVKKTPFTVDSGKAYFPYIYDVLVFEEMTEAYDQNGLYVYYMSLIKLCPTRAFTKGNSFTVIQEESSRRRSQFIETIYRTMKKQPKKLPMFSEKIQISIANS